MKKSAKKVSLVLFASAFLLTGCGETVSEGVPSSSDGSENSVSQETSSAVSSSKERKPELVALENSLNSVFSSENQFWTINGLSAYLSVGKHNEADTTTGDPAYDSVSKLQASLDSLSLACNGTKSADPSGLTAAIALSGVKAEMDSDGNGFNPMFTTTNDAGETVEVPQDARVFMKGYDAYYDLSLANEAYAVINYYVPTLLKNQDYDTEGWTIPQQGHYAIDGDLKTKYTNDIFPMLGQYLPQIGTMEVAMLEMAYEANPSDFVVTNDNGHYTFTADTTNVAHLYSNVESVLNSLGVDVLITKQDLPMLSEDLTVEGALKWVKAVTDSMTINKLKVTFDYTATVFNKVDVDIDVVWDEARIKADLAAKGDTASWPLAFKLATSASAKTGDEAKITLPDFAGYTDFVMPPKKAVA
jgi:hypothetical protein